MTRASVFAFAVLFSLHSGSALSASITVTPGTSPAGTYIPLAVFGNIAPTPLGDDDLVNIDTANFVWAGQTWNRIAVASNGYVVVGGGTLANDLSYMNTSFPNNSTPNNVLAPFWTDLNPGGGGEIRTGTVTNTYTGNKWLVIDWNAVPLFESTLTTETFQIWIGINGVEDITFVYDGVTLPAELTIGAEDATGTVGASYYFNGAGTPVTRYSELRVSSEGFPLQVAQTPIPGALPLFASGLGLLTYMGYRRRKAA